MDVQDSQAEKPTPPFNEFSDPRLVAIYDTVNPIDVYKPFYLELAANLSPSSIIDIGCGTGLLTYELARQGHNMIGLEPASAMLNIARRRNYDKEVKWIEGDTSNLSSLRAELAILTGHVAQFFLNDASWHAALKDIYRALKSGSHLAFESRNPNLPAFTSWPTKTSRQKVNDPVAGQVEWWWHHLETKGNRARYEIHYLFTESREEVVSENELVFRSQTELSQSLIDAGFSVEHIFGNWDRSPVNENSPELIFVAARQ